MSDTRQFCTFYLDDHLFGVDAKGVQEVLKHQELTTVPLAPEIVKGLMNLRGQIVTAIDIRNRLGLPPRPSDEFPMNVVLSTDDGATSLLVDRIGDVLHVDEVDFEMPPETLTGSARDLILGAYKLDDGLLLVLDAQEALNTSAPLQL